MKTYNDLKKSKLLKINQPKTYQELSFEYEQENKSSS